MQTLRKSNKEIIDEYFEALQTEINPSDNYIKINRNTLTKLSDSLKINFNAMKRDDIVSYLNSLRKPEDDDPLHKWIGTYNLHVGNLVRFFKWLCSPDLDPRQRPKPKVMSNIPKLQRFCFYTGQ
jgi:integrase/recombinase XerD